MGFLDLFLDLDKFIAKMLDVVNRLFFNAMMLIRFVFSAHRLGFLMLLRFVALDWVPIRFVFECYSDWGFECHMPKWNPLIKKLFDSLVYKFFHNM